MRVFHEVAQWLLAIGEILQCYYFVSVLEDKELIHKNKVYILLCSIGIGTILAFNRRSAGLLSWFMLMVQSILIFISLEIKNRGSVFLKLGIILVCNICIAFLQLFAAFGTLALFPKISIEQVYDILNIYRVTCYILALLIMCVIYIIIRYNKKIKSVSLEPFRWTFFFYGIAGIFLVIAFQHQLLVYGRTRSLESVFILLMLVGATVSMLVGSIKSVETQTELEMLEIKNKMLKDNYKEIQNMYQNYAYTYHDMKNHLIVLENYCKERDLEKVIDYVEKIQEPIRQVKRYFNSNIEVLDIIINFKLVEAEKKGICVEVVIDEMEELSIEESDLCAIFSNLLDNAIEACECIGDGEKWIRILVKSVGDMLYINISNSYFSESGDEKGGRSKFQTVKKGLHGYGIKSVKTKVEKYGGDASWHCKGNVFIVTITFYDVKKGGEVCEGRDVREPGRGFISGISRNIKS